MKINFQFLLVSLLFITTTSFYGCQKDSPSDPADKFVGEYSYTITAPDLGFQSGDMTVSKTGSSKISLLMTGGTPISQLVDGNSITEEVGQQIELFVTPDSTAIFTENSTGILDGKVLTINGTWSNPDFTALAFKIVAIKK